MSKRRQTTGMPKPERRTPPPVDTGASGKAKRDQQPIREFRSRAEREAEIQRYVILGTAAAIGVVVVILGIALIVSEFINPRRAVASVNGDSISVAEFEDQVRLQRLIANERINNGIAQFLSFGFTSDPNEAFNQLLQSDPELSSLWNELSVPDQLGIRVLNNIIDDRLIRAEAENRGLNVTEEDIQEQINQFFSYDPERVAELEAAAEATPESTAEGTAEATAEGTESAAVTSDVTAEASAEAEATTDPDATPALLPGGVTATPVPTATATPLVSPTPSATPTGTPTPTATPEGTAESTAEATDVVPTPTLLPTLPPPATRSADQIREAYEDAQDVFYRRARDLGISRAQVDNYFEGLAIREKLREAIGEEQVGDTATWANVRHILVPLENQERAQDILDALNNGESFAALARTSSTDTGSGARGGELDWADISNYVEPFREAVRNAAIGEIVGPVESEFGYHIIQVRAREERPVEGENTTAINQAFDQWLEDYRTAQEEAGNVDTNSIWTDFVPEDPAFVYEPR